MNADMLLAHYERIADAPDAVARLRRFVFDLAVRGKLVPQNPAEAPSPALLKRRGIPHSIDGAFHLPPSWAWVNVGAVADARLGKMLDKAKNRGTPRPYLRNINVRWFDFDLSDLLEMPFENSELTEFSLRSGDVLICEGGEPGRAAVWDERETGIYFQKAIHRVRFFEFVDTAYFVNALRLSADDGRLQEYFTGTGIQHFTGKGLDRYLFPLPPLAEQHRIVAKVDELVALCDRLEAARTAREATRDRLAATTLARLNAPDAETFPTDAAFAFNILPNLTTRPDQIETMRQTILTLAVRGILVPQDANDEPASELLNRIAKEKFRLIAEKKLKHQKELVPINSADLPFEVHAGWSWSKADDVFLNITDGFHNTPTPVAEGFPYVTAKHVRPRKIDFHNCLRVDVKNHRELFSKTRVKRGDILIVNIGAGCGTPAMVDVDYEFSFKNVAIVNLPSIMDGHYVLLFLMHYRGIVFDELIKGGAQPFLGLGMLREMLIPLPPLAEQRRIVAKVDALMTLCDRLEASLNAVAETRRRLLDAVLAEALTTPAKIELEAAQ